MLFKYNHSNPGLKNYYRDTVDQARKEVKDQIRFWKLVFLFFVGIVVVSLGLMLYFAIANSVNLALRDDYVTAQVLVDTVDHLAIIFGVSFLLTILGGIGLYRSFDNRYRLEKEIERNGKKIL